MNLENLKFLSPERKRELEWFKAGPGVSESNSETNARHSAGHSAGHLQRRESVKKKNHRSPGGRGSLAKTALVGSVLSSQFGGASTPTQSTALSPERHNAITKTLLERSTAHQHRALESLPESHPSPHYGSSTSLAVIESPGHQHSHQQQSLSSTRSTALAETPLYWKSHSPPYYRQGHPSGSKPRALPPSSASAESATSLAVVESPSRQSPFPKRSTALAETHWNNHSQAYYGHPSGSNPQALGTARMSTTPYWNHHHTSSYPAPPLLALGPADVSGGSAFLSPGIGAGAAGSLALAGLIGAKFAKALKARRSKRSSSGGEAPIQSKTPPAPRRSERLRAKREAAAASISK
jgi:hypothetical protein